MRTSVGGRRAVPDVAVGLGLPVSSATFESPRRMDGGPRAPELGILR